MSDPSLLPRITATPAAGSEFTGWTGDCSGTGTCSLPITASKSVTAAFEPTTRTPSSSRIENRPQPNREPWIRNAVTTASAATARPRR